MLTPQEITELKSGLERAIFGGYSVRSVEEFLTPLREDYSALYKENAVLKSKMKVLVEKLEEYREQEDSIKKALLKAQAAADDMVANAERRSAKMLSDSEQRLRSRSQELSMEIQSEQDRADMAKESTARFIAEIQERFQAQLAELEQIKAMDCSNMLPAPDPVPSLPEAKQDSGNISRIFDDLPMVAK